MIRALFRLLLTLAVLAGIMLPKSSVALAQLGLIPAQVLVICTGQSLRTIVLDREGNPVEVEQTEQTCLLADASDTAQRESLPLRALIFADIMPRRGETAHPCPARYAEEPSPRAPPAA